MLAASFVVARATAEHIARFNLDEVSFVITGKSLGREGDEDKACGEYIQSLLERKTPQLDKFTERVYQSTAGKSFQRDGNHRTMMADLSLSLAVDRFAFALPVFRQGDHMTMYPVRL